MKFPCALDLMDILLSLNYCQRLSERCVIFFDQAQYPVTFGAASISGEGGGYGFGDITEDDAISLVHEAFEKGITYFDTAPIYGFGLSEKRLGKAFKANREKVKLISKCGITWHENKRVNLTNDPEVTRKMLEQSLRDLESDYIDLYMVHWPDERCDIRKTVEVLAKAQLEGKIKHIGLCNTFLADLELAEEVAKIDVVQSELNIFERKSMSLFEELSKRNIEFMSWGTLDKGIITGRVDRNRKFDSSDCRSSAPWWKQMDKEFKYKKMEIINDYLKTVEHSPLELAIGFNLNFDVVKSALCGVRNSDQLNGVIRALENLPNEDVINHTLEIIRED